MNAASVVVLLPQVRAKVRAVLLVSKFFYTCVQPLTDYCALLGMQKRINAMSLQLIT